MTVKSFEDLEPTPAMRFRGALKAVKAEIVRRIVDGTIGIVEFDAEISALPHAVAHDPEVRAFRWLLT